MHTSKRLYIGLLGGTLLLGILLCALVWFLFQYRHLIVNKVLLFTIIITFAIMLVFLSIGILALVIMIRKSKSLPFFDGLIKFINEFLFPLTIITGRILRINKNKIQRSFIEVNNHLVRIKNILISSKEIMILLPHCLQNSNCRHKITIDINNCRSCGKCKVGELKAFAENNDTIIKVATGGTMARKFIIDNKPKGIIAVACERDLSTGIQDIGVIPVLGVLNCFTKGPCIDTDVNINDIINAYKIMCKGVTTC